MRGLQFVPPDTNFPFMRWRWVYVAISSTIVIGSILLTLFHGLNYGTDFRGGLLLEVATQGPADLPTLRRTLGSLDLGEVGLQTFGADNTVLIRIEMQEGGDRGQTEALARVREALGPGVDYRRTEIVGPQVSAELLLDGVYATVCALVAIMLYIWARFGWIWGLTGVMALLHDVIATVGVFAVTGMEFNLTSVAALLTIAGYSINDSVVVYDRARENLRKYKTMPFRDVVDLSINQTLSRTVLTGLTTIVVLVVLCVFGGEVLRGFSVAMLFGVVFGTYSSVCVALTLLLIFRAGRPTAPLAADQGGAAGVGTPT